MSKLSAPQDSCWDSVCSSNNPQEKLPCLNTKANDICNCCKQNNIGDCTLMIPGYGEYDVCKKQFSDGKTYEEVVTGVIAPVSTPTCIGFAKNLVQKYCSPSVKNPLTNRCFLRRSNQVQSCCSNSTDENVKKSEECNASSNFKCIVSNCGRQRIGNCVRDKKKRLALCDCCKKNSSNCQFGSIDACVPTKEELEQDKTASSSSVESYRMYRNIRQREGMCPSSFVIISILFVIVGLILLKLSKKEQK